MGLEFQNVKLAGQSVKKLRWLQCGWSVVTYVSVVKILTLSLHNKKKSFYLGDPMLNRGLLSKQ